MWFVGLIDLEHHTARDSKAIWALEKLSTAHALHSAQGWPNLTSCEDLAMALIVLFM